VDTTPSAIRSDECFRCGYNLHSIADDHPCPECGLLAIRSRRPTDELHDNRPYWLRDVSRGLDLVLTCVVLLVTWPLVLGLTYLLSQHWFSHLPQTYFELLSRYFCALVFGPSAIALVFGGYFLTRAEGEAAADQADRVLRWSLRLSCIVPAFVLPKFSFENVAFGVFDTPNSLSTNVAIIIFIGGFAPLPVLLFARLRDLALRAHRQTLPRHCKFVGFGTAATIVLMGVYLWIPSALSRTHWRFNWATDPSASLYFAALIVLVTLACTVWSLILLANIAMAFHAANRESARKWARDDRARVNESA
jgi:hypothetical protein